MTPENESSFMLDWKLRKGVNNNALLNKTQHVFVVEWDWYDTFTVLFDKLYAILFRIETR